MFTNLDFIHSASSAQLKDFYCKDRECGRCQFGGIACGFMSWLFSEHIVEKPEKPVWSDEPLETLKLKPSAYSILREWGINTLGQLSLMRKYDLLRLPNIGATAVSEIAGAFERFTGTSMSP